MLRAYSSFLVEDQELFLTLSMWTSSHHWILSILLKTGDILFIAVSEILATLIFKLY